MPVGRCRWARTALMILLFSILAILGAGCATTGAKVTSPTSPPAPLGATLTISGVAASGITTSGATITWTTNTGATSQVEYGTSASYGTMTTLDSTPRTSHSQVLS